MNNLITIILLSHYSTDNIRILQRYNSSGDLDSYIRVVHIFHHFHHVRVQNVRFFKNPSLSSPNIQAAVFSSQKRFTVLLKYRAGLFKGWLNLTLS